MADATYKLVGVVRSNGSKMTTPKDGGEGKPYAEVEIEDVVGMKVKWTTFHVSVVTPLQLGKWYEFEVSTPAKKGGGVWHNLESVVRGPMQKPDPGTTGHEAASAAIGPAHTVKSDHQFKIERTSLQRQGAMGIVLRLMEVGIPMNQMEETITEVLKHSETIEAFYERPIAEQEAPKQKRSRKAPEQAELPAREPEAHAPSTNGTELQVPEFAHLGALLTWFTGEFKGKTSHDLCELMKVKAPSDIEDYAAAAEAAKAKWGTAA